ncbi:MULTISPECIES: EamA family transporter [Cycloclasticus]|jgi:phosphonate utilization associated putative membrane protein|uniref:EamA family transporter n=1 Tax=Cycloclasticus TaxID=34067 RepID=UPI00240A015F|nr:MULTISPECIES: EamA family transporter [Cycloclasticus]MBV1899195.1 EamA family transporter [Cycloclasticus sp.]MDF1762447.1 EamA family transporter [Thalassolituus sp.]MDF1830342.1 EamA family transporter [Cycloclasticus pugetii]
MMTQAALLIGLSVMMHVAWNLLAKHVDKEADYLWWGLLAHLVLLGPFGLYYLVFDADWQSPLVLAMLVTVIANSVYFVSLRRAYHFAPVALVYPLARSSPVLIAFWSMWFFDEELPLQAWLAILISIVGLWLLGLSARGGDTAHALPWALVAALFTSIYSLSDKVAVSYLPSFGALLGFVSVGYLGSFIALSVQNRYEKGRVIPIKRPALKYLLPGGLFIGTAYALVIQAMYYLPAAYVVSFSNAGIVLANILAMSLLKERYAWRWRLVATLIICVGLVLLGLS